MGQTSSRGNRRKPTTYSHLPPHEELTLKHEKEIARQEVQNKLYEDII